MINSKIKLDKEFKYLLEKSSFCDNGQGYPVACINGKKTYLHQLILGRKDGFVIDHINRDKLDNRRENLRFITQRQNCLNVKLNKNNTSGHRGIQWNKEISKYVARITHFRKSIHIGSFAKIEDAIKARKDAELKYGFNLEGS